ncbi:MAG: thymidine phosphorylase [Spirochaetaceae bacterium]
MRATDLIARKRDGGHLDKEELHFLIDGYVSGSIPDYQISAWLMAVFFRGMSRAEAAALTQEMIDSGSTMDLSGLSGPLIDKHSTGGVGDKVSLILAPLAASLGVQVPMMSGRALGHTGGTLDKLESIPGYTTGLSPAEFRRIVSEVGYGMTGQSERIVPADRKLYALRDVTATVESIPLITTSILSKKFAEGAEKLVFDVKCGRGAFMKDLEQARVLATHLTETGRSLGKGVAAVITNMDDPLGAMVGNFLEVEEACACLGGEGRSGKVTPDHRSEDLLAVTVRLTAWMLIAAGKAETVEEAEAKCRENLGNGAAWQRFLANVRAQGGDEKELLARLGEYRAPVRHAVSAEQAGVLFGIDAFKTGMAAVYLGVGRNQPEDEVLPDVGIEVLKKPGQEISRGEALCRLYGRTQEAVDAAVEMLSGAFDVRDGETFGQKTMILDEHAEL